MSPPASLVLSSGQFGSAWTSKMPPARKVGRCHSATNTLERLLAGSVAIDRLSATAHSANDGSIGFVAGALLGLSIRNSKFEASQ